MRGTSDLLTMNRVLSCFRTFTNKDIAHPCRTKVGLALT